VAKESKVKISFEERKKVFAKKSFMLQISRMGSDFQRSNSIFYFIHASAASFEFIHAVVEVAEALPFILRLYCSNNREYPKLYSVKNCHSWLSLSLCCNALPLHSNWQTK